MTVAGWKGPAAESARAMPPELIIAVRAGWGAALLLAPERRVKRRTVRLASRVLGLRHLVEAGVRIADRDRPPSRWLIAFDGTHATTMLVLAARKADLRRAALASASAAMCLAALAEFERRTLQRRRRPS